MTPRGAGGLAALGHVCPDTGRLAGG